MPRDGKITRTKILDAAQEAILGYGYGGTSIDMLLAKTGITKGAFFYHFKSKAELARALLERYVESDRRMLEDCMGRAEKLSREPLPQLLIFLELLLEMFESMKSPYSCLFASYYYQEELFDDEVKQRISDTVRSWRLRVGDKLRAIAEKQAPRMPVDLDSVADNLTAVLEGAFIMSKTYNDGGMIASQFRHYKNYIELLFMAENS